MKFLAILALSVVLAGCSALGSSGQTQMCQAAGSLSAARALVEQAADKDARGDTSGARTLAEKAATLAKQGHDVLQSVPSSDVKRDATWQALLDAYLHIGQGANALLPGYEGTYGSTGEELTSGTKSLQAAAANLPAVCLTASPSP
jgi:outer membrane PBP1 activator LpoA protein